MFARVPEPIPGFLFVGDAVPATFLERRLLHRLRRPSGLPYHVSQCFLSHLSHSSFLSKRTWLCSFALSVSAASALLLPLSIISNEVIVLYPHSDYVQWLNPSLIKGSVVHLFPESSLSSCLSAGLWNLVFLGCNLSLFLCLPFAYLFSESAGLACFSKVRVVLLPPTLSFAISPILRVSCPECMRLY